MPAWFCPCPRCQLAAWDFDTQGQPSGQEWQQTESGWTWSPSVGQHEGGYKLYAKSDNCLDIRLSIPLYDNVLNTCLITLSLSASAGRVFLIIGDTYTLAAAPLPGNPAAVTLGLCRGSQYLIASAILYDGDGTPIATLTAPLAPPTPPPSPNQFFGSPTASIPNSTRYVALSAHHWPTTDNCCPPCPPNTCLRMGTIYPRAWTYPLAIYGHASLHAEIHWASPTADWAIFRLGTCCPDNTGSVLEIDVALGLRNVQLRFYDCGSYHGSAVINLPFSADWTLDNTPKDWSIDLCIAPAVDGLDLTVSVRGPGATAFVTRRLYTDWTYFHKLCWPEIQGNGNPSHILAWATTFEMTHPQTVADGTVDVCSCFPIRSSGLSPECRSIICEESDVPDLAIIATLTGLSGAGQPYNGAYVLSNECQAPTSTESTSAEPLDESPASSPFISAAVRNWMTANFPEVTNLAAYPYYCRHAYCTTTYLAPMGWEFLSITHYWPATIDAAYRTRGLIPMFAVVLLVREYWNQTTPCNTAAQAIFLGAAAWPQCPNYPQTTLQLVAHRERRCPSWSSPEDCPPECDQSLEAITNGTVTIDLQPL